MFKNKSKQTEDSIETPEEVVEEAEDRSAYSCADCEGEGIAGNIICAKCGGTGKI